MARRAGMTQAIVATPSNRSGTPTKVTGSVAVPPNSRLLMKRVSGSLVVWIKKRTKNE